MQHALIRAGKREHPVWLTGLRGSARAVVAAELIRANPDKPVLMLAPSAKACDALAEDLRAVLGEGEAGPRVVAYPRHDTLPYDRFSPQPFVVCQRMSVLYRWLASGGSATASKREPAPIVIATWTALALRVPSRALLRRRTLQLEVGHSVDRDELVASLVDAGYARMALVEERGELAVRGGIIDIFPPHRARPARIELLGDEVESIREFDPASQRSMEPLLHVAAPPPRELVLERDTVIERAEELRMLGLELEAGDREVDELVDALIRGSVPPGAEALAPILIPELESVLDFLPDDTLVIADDPEQGRTRLVEYCKEAEQGYVASLEGRRIAAKPGELLLSADALDQGLRERRPVWLSRLDVVGAEDDGDETAERIALSARDQEPLRRGLAATRTHEHALAPLADLLAQWSSDRWRTVLTCPSLSGAERLRSLLGDYTIDTHLEIEPRPIWRWSAPGRVEIRVARLTSGVELESERLAIVTEEEIFGPRERRHRKTSWKEGSALDGIGQLAPGDYLVHSEHGIGTYRGLLELKAGRVNAELLCIEYLGGDRLFLPVHRLNQVQRYGGADGATPRIDRLGGQTWESAKRRVQKGMRNMARELLSVHAARELAPGFAFSPRDPYFEEFEASFPFEETPDQQGAIEDVLADMQRSKPMDRLVCGDVGYGKTEVAIRAAFRAALNGKQVAVLVPTTILCQQHWETFSRRFEGYPIRVESLSRFSSNAEARDVIEGLASGQIDVVIGTHRLLHKRVEFKELGLLVVDEEQRFGVSHKERIKKIKKTVDVLTLTATPIPRTLQMAFTGVRDLSVIDTPPTDRYAVRTQLCRWSESLLREAILREQRRGGQIFFVHNRVRTIGQIAEVLDRLVPEVSYIVAHGQMKESELEDKMHTFIRGEADLLLCTTIIESGLDIPRANTIIINRAHALGLAQLYQLRGRVGRSDKRAYAYLIVPPEDSITHDAQKRLEAIHDFSELSSGFRLASMDLEIRGAGDLLGREQSGSMLAVGYETYMEMLEETIEELRGKIREVEVDPEIRLPVEARLPEAYVPDVSQRLVLYKRLASARDDDDLERIRDEILDRCGPLPLETENLFEVIRLKILARRLGIQAVDLTRGQLVFSVSQTTHIDPQRLIHLMTHAGSGLRVTPDHKIFSPAPPLAGGPAAVFEAAREVLGQLGGA
jgi:transcription-repair coupling factor (superfamily II helicase)